MAAIICFGAGYLAAVLAAISIMGHSKERRGRDGLAIGLVMFLVGVAGTAALAPLLGVLVAGAAFNPDVRELTDAVGMDSAALIAAAILFVILYLGLCLTGWLFVHASDDLRPKPDSPGDRAEAGRVEPGFTPRR